MTVINVAAVATLSAPHDGDREYGGESNVAKRKIAAKDSPSAESIARELTFDREEQYKRKLDVILRTATYCLNELGYSGTSLRALAARLKITDSALYHYVRSKDELAFLCYCRTLDYSEQALARANALGKTGLEKLQLYIRSQIESTCGPDGPTATLSDLPSIRIAHRIQILRRVDAAHDTVIGFFEEGFADGSVTKCNAVDAASVIWGSMAFLAKWFDRHAKRDVKSMAATYVHVLTRGIAAR